MQMGVGGEWVLGSYWVVAFGRLRHGRSLFCLRLGCLAWLFLLQLEFISYISSTGLTFRKAVL